MKARIIAYYLPQFHPIPENDKFWGKGFTEWTNVAKAKPLFKGHIQPKIPADLGFYDLRLPEIREQQAKLAKEAGIEGFCYYHYWMGNGKILLERPFKEVLESGKPDFPFCLAWANHEWTTKTWDKSGKHKVISTIEYPGIEDYVAHFYHVLPAFKDKRYITIEEKPLFCIFDPYSFTDVNTFINVWQKLATENGLKGIYFTAMINNTTTIKRLQNGEIVRTMPNLKSSKDLYNDILSLGFNGINSFGKARGEMIAQGKIWRNIKKAIHKKFSFLPPTTLNYPKIVKYFFAPEDNWENIFPTIMPNWDRTPRAGKAEEIYVNSTPENFQDHIEDAINFIKNKDSEHRILFLKSWNEWGEGNYVEPDIKYGHAYLEAIKKSIE